MIPRPMQWARHSIFSHLTRTTARACQESVAASTTCLFNHPRQLHTPASVLSFRQHIFSAYKSRVPPQGTSFLRPILPGPERGFNAAADFSSEPGRACWSCGSCVEAPSPFFCPSCHKIHPSDASLDFFQLLGIPKSFEVNVAELEARYKALQRQLHPDLFALHSKIEQEFSAENSSRVIEAYYTLLRVLSRSNYLLKLASREIGEQAGVQDMGLLQEIMEVREAIEDADGEEAVLRDIQEQNEERMRTCEVLLKQAFVDESWSAATELVHRLTYLEKIREELKKGL